MQFHSIIRRAQWEPGLRPPHPACVGQARLSKGSGIQVNLEVCRKQPGEWSSSKSGKAYAKARSNRAQPRLSSLARRQGAPQGWCVVGAELGSRQGPDHRGPREYCLEVRGRWQGDTSALWRMSWSQSRTEAGPWRLPPLAQQQPWQPRATPNNSKNFRPNVLFCEASRIL